MRIDGQKKELLEKYQNNNNNTCWQQILPAVHCQEFSLTSQVKSRSFFVCFFFNVQLVVANRLAVCSKQHTLQCATVCLLTKLIGAIYTLKMLLPQHECHWTDKHIYQHKLLYVCTYNYTPIEMGVSGRYYTFNYIMKIFK